MEKVEGVETMRQVQYSKYHGGSKVLEFVEVPMPTPKKGEVLVRVEASSVNPVDWRIQDGIAKHLLPLQFPFVPGTDVAAEVVTLGPGVTGFKPGDKVIAYLHVLKGGAFAEYAVALAARTVTRPSEVSAAEGACAVVAGYTALQSAQQAGIRSFTGGSEHLNVLIPGASGGVGVLLLQLVKLAGAHATVTCGQRNMELLRSLKADEVLDYRTPEGAAYASPSGRKYHIVLNCANYVPPASFATHLQPGAKVVDLTPSVAGILTALRNKLWAATGRAQYRYENFYMADTREDLETMMQLMRLGKVRAVVDSCFPLRRAGDAWDRSMARHSSGKIIVCLDSPSFSAYDDPPLPSLSSSAMSCAALVAIHHHPPASALQLTHRTSSHGLRFPRPSADHPFKNNVLCS